MNKQVQLPKGYLSYSQLALWLSNKERYKQIYFDGREDLRPSNMAMDYGKVVADLLEREERSDDLLTDTAMSLLPKYDIADKEIRTLLKTKDGRGIEILIKPDSLDSVSYSFLEYKTGKVPWTQNKANKHLQLSFYAAGIFLNYFIVPPSVKLVWIETEKTEEGIKPTGRIETFEVDISVEDIKKTLELIRTIAEEIEIAFAYHVTNPEVVNF